MKMQKYVILVCKEKFENKNLKDEKYRKVRDHCHYTAYIYSICNLKYSVPKKIPTVFHNGSNYDYHFIIRIQKTIYLFRKKH